MMIPRKMIVKVENKMRMFVDNLQDNEVLVLIVLARKKYNPEFPKSSRVIARETVTKENYQRKTLKLLTLMMNYYSEAEYFSPADMNLYVTVNPRSTRKAMRALKVHMAEREAEDDHGWLYGFNSKWFSCLQKKAARSRRSFYIVDVDTKDDAVLTRVYEAIPNPPGYEMASEVGVVVGTRGGYHIVMPPFDIQQFNKNLGEEKLPVEVKTDDCVMLWSGAWEE